MLSKMQVLNIKIVNLIRKQPKFTRFLPHNREKNLNSTYFHGYWSINNTYKKLKPRHQSRFFIISAGFFGQCSNFFRRKS